MDESCHAVIRGPQWPLGLDTALPSNHRRFKNNLCPTEPSLLHTQEDWYCAHTAYNLSCNCSLVAKCACPAVTYMHTHTNILLHTEKSMMPLYICKLCPWSCWIVIYHTKYNDPNVVTHCTQTVIHYCGFCDWTLATVNCILSKSHPIIKVSRKTTW